MSHALIWSSLNLTNLVTEDISEIPFAGLGTNVANTWNKKLYQLKWLNTSVDNVKIWLEDEYADIYIGTPYPVIKKSDSLKIKNDLGFDFRITVLDSYNLKQLPDAIAATSKNLDVYSGSELLAPLYVDGVMVSENKNILVRSQTTRSQNGLFSVKLKNPSSDLYFANAQDIITASYIVGDGTSSFYAYSDSLKPLEKAKKGDVNFVWVDRTSRTQLQNVKAATTSNLSTSGGYLSLSSVILDNFTLTLSDRVLVKDQTTSKENGIYYVSSLYDTDTNTITDPRSSIASSDDFWDTAATYISQNYPVNVEVINGSTNGGKYYRYYSASTGSTANLLWTDATHYYNTDTVAFYYEVPIFTSSLTVKAATADTLSYSPTYSSNILSAGSAGTLFVDGIGVTTASDLVLIKNQSAQLQNGVYSLTRAGDGTTTYILTRSTSYDSTSEITKTKQIYVSSGTANSSTSWYLSVGEPVSIGTSSVTFEKLISFDNSVASGTFTSTPSTIKDYNGNLVNLSVSDKILLKHSNQAYNGIYTVGTVGVGTNGIWARNTSYDTAAEIAPTFIKVTNNKNSLGGFTYFLNKSVTYQSNFILNTDTINISERFTNYVYEPVTNTISSEISSFSNVNAYSFTNSSIATNQRILVYGQITNPAQNGIYTVSSLGSSVNSLLYSPSYYIKRGAIATVSTGSTYFLYADGTSEGAGSTSVKWVDISTVSLVACQAYTETDKTSSTYLADTDFDVTVSTGDKVVVNSSNRSVNGIYDVTLGSATRAKFRFDTGFANWMNKIFVNVLTNNLTTNVLNTYVSGDLMGQITGAYQVVSTGGSTKGNIYVPELSFPPTASYETYFTTSGQASELLHESNVDWYEQDFQKYVVNAIYYAPNTTGFPSAAGTAISRTVRSSTGNTLLNENDSVLVHIGTGASSENTNNGIYRVKYVTTGSTGSSIYLTKHEDFTQTVYQTGSYNVKTVASPYERPIQVNINNTYYFRIGSATTYNYDTAYLQGYLGFRNESLGQSASTSDDSNHYNVGSEFYYDESDVRITANTSDLARFPKTAAFQHYIYKGKSFTLTPSESGNNASDYKYPSYSFTDDVLKITFPNRLYTKLSASSYYYWEEGDRIIYEDNSIPALYDPNYYKFNGIYQIVWAQNANSSYTYWCKRVKYAATNGHLDYAKRLSIKTGYTQADSNFYLALPNALTTTYTWNQLNYDKDFMDCIVVDSSGVTQTYEVNNDFSINPVTGLLSRVVSFSSGTFYAYLYQVDFKLQIKTGYSASDPKIYLAQPDKLTFTYCWNESDYPNIKVFNVTSGSYTYYEKGVDYTLNAREGYIKPINAFLTTGTLNVYISSTPRYNQTPKSLMNRFYNVEQVLTDRSAYKNSSGKNSSSYSIDAYYIQNVKLIKNSSVKDTRLTFDKRQRFNVVNTSNHYLSTVGYVLTFGDPNDFIYKKRLSQDGLNYKIDSKSEYVYTGYSSLGNSLGLYSGQFSIDRSTNNWVNGYSFTASDKILIKHNFTDPTSENKTLTDSQKSTYYNDNNRSVRNNAAGKVDQKVYSYISGFDTQATLTYNTAFTDPISVLRASVINSLGTNYYCLYFDPDATNRATDSRYWINESGRTSFIGTTTTTANLSNLYNVGSTINGRTLLNNDLILVKDQTAKSQNGIYIVKVNPVYNLTRATDLDASAEMRALGNVSFGSKNFELILPNTTPYVLGTTNMVWSPVKTGYSIDAAVVTTSNYSAGTLITQFPDTIDSYTLSADDKVFLKAQTATDERYVGRFTKNVNAKLSRVSSTPSGVGDTSYFNISNVVVRDTNRSLNYELYFNPNYTGLGVSSIYWFRQDQSVSYDNVKFISSYDIGVGSAVTYPGAFKGDRILLRSQTGSTGLGSTENSIYFIDENTTFILQRHDLLNTSDDISTTTRVKVTSGIANSGIYGLVYDESTSPEINTTSLYWANVRENPYLADVACTTTTNITLGSPPSVIDNYTLAKNDRVLVKNQSTLSQNGIYVVSNLESNTWIRATDLDTDSELNPQLSVHVGNGTTGGGNYFRIKLPVPRDITTSQLTNYIIGTDNIEWATVDKDGLFNSSPDTWSSLDAGSSNFINLGNASMTSDSISYSKRFGIAIKTPSTSVLSGNGITASGNIRNLKIKVEYKTVED